MKKWTVTVLVIALALLPGTGLLAQSVSDDIEQLVLDVQKLNQLKQILQDMYNAYTIVHQGYEDIKSLSEGTFSLHKAFLDGLLAVSPAVGSYAKVSDILNKETMLVQEYQAANRYFQGSGGFTPQELDYFSGVYGNLFQASNKNVGELTMVITAGQLRMSDAERLAAIDRVDRDITGQLNFLRSFNNGASVQLAQRQKEARDVGTLRLLYGVGP
jgi:DNA repair ATPase RecN